jgi:hypothetical protein
VNRAALAALAVLIAAAISGCGSIGPKQVRIEGGAIASAASEASELADQRLRGRVPVRFTRVQAQTLAEQFAKSQTAITAKPAEPESRAMVNAAASLALAGQKQALLLQSEVDNRAQVAAAKGALAQISMRADDLASTAEAREAAK